MQRRDASFLFIPVKVHIRVWMDGLSKQELDVKGVSHKVYEREIECIEARKIGRTH